MLLHIPNVNKSHSYMHSSMNHSFNLSFILHAFTVLTVFSFLRSGIFPRRQSAVDIICWGLCAAIWCWDWRLLGDLWSKDHGRCLGNKSARHCKVQLKWLDDYQMEFVELAQYPTVVGCINHNESSGWKLLWLAVCMASENAIFNSCFRLASCL